MFTDDDIGEIDATLAARYDLTKLESEPIPNLLSWSKGVKRAAKRACGDCDLAFTSEL